MKRIQDEIIKILKVKPNINPEEEVKIRVQFIKDYLIKTNSKKLILGISGGQDSTLTGKVAQIAITELRKETNDDEYEFIAVHLPYGLQHDEDDAQLALNFINPDKVFTFNIKSMTDTFIPEYERVMSKTIRDYDKGNVKARIRMVAQYLLGAIENGENALVLGTDHASEAVTGFFTKFGDGAADIIPLTGLTKRQGKMLLMELNAPEQLYSKTPTADLLDNNPGQADEDELGISYEELDDYLEGKLVPDHISEKIEKRYLLTRHKRELPVTPFDNWWK
jgi:NAD+ synthase